MMGKLRFYFGYALRSLRRDGTRTFLAGLSVTFGVLSLVAMQLLSNTLLHGSLFDARLQMGGDAVIFAPHVGNSLSTTELKQIDRWQQGGVIARTAYLSNAYLAYLRTPTNGRVTLIQRATGIDPAHYPLIGDFTLRAPVGKSPADVLIAPSDALITRDIAGARGLSVGDTFTLTAGGAPLQLTVAGIVDATPTQQGLQVFYTLETARLLENRTDVVTEVSVLLGDAPNAQATLQGSSFSVRLPPTREQMVQESSGRAIFDMMLKGAGVLGLLVGGLGVMNTLQMILARRKLEIAMLKTVGYQRSDLLFLIGIETGLIGLFGGLLGALIGTLIARALLNVFADTGAILIAWSPDPVVVAGGVAAGGLTAVAFGLQTIIATSGTRPVVLLRNQPYQQSRMDRAVQLGLYALLMLLFGLLIGIVLGSPLLGIGYMIAGSALLLLIRIVFWAVLWLVTRLPAPLPLLRLTRANLRRSKMRASLALLALFAGAFAVTFAAVAISNAQAQAIFRHGDERGFNLAILTTLEQSNQAVEALNGQHPLAAYKAAIVPALVNGQALNLDGRTTADLVNLTYTGEWREAADNGLMPASMSNQFRIGDVLTVQANGQEQAITVTGFYTLTDPYDLTRHTNALMVPLWVAQTLGGEHTQMQVVGQFPLELLDTVASTLGTALPNDLVFSQVDLDYQLDANFHGLFVFAISIASLAFVAGAVLIANAAGLAVVERRREIGVFKAVGYTSLHVLWVFVTEYAFLGAVAGAFGLIGVLVAVGLVNNGGNNVTLMLIRCC